MFWAEAKPQPSEHVYDVLLDGLLSGVRWVLGFVIGVGGTALIFLVSAPHSAPVELDLTHVRFDERAVLDVSQVADLRSDR